MSTPSVTILKNLVLNWKSNQMEEETIATFYRHWDGYPSCHAVDIANSLIVASRTKPEHIDFSGASVERGILNNRNWCQHFLKAMCMVDADIEFIGEDNVPSASYTYVVTGAYDNFGGKDSIGAEEYLSRINIKVYEGDENGNLVFEGGALNVWHGLTDIAGIAKSSEGHPGGCPFSLAFLEPPCGRREGAGALRERGLGGWLSHPSNSLRVGLGTLRPLKARKSLLLGGNGGTDLPGFPTFRQAPGRSRNPPPIEMLKTPSSRETIGRRRGKAGHAAAAR